MTDVAIRVENLGKCYRLGERLLVPYKSLRQAVTDRVASFNRRVQAIFNSSSTKPLYSERNIIWALRHVSFDVKPGEVVGIIGPNGAGKSTLLKIISRITEPTEGYSETVGRIGSLLEVGTGFHTELTGRENIYLSGAIQGMSREEIKRKFDEIVAFAEVEKFLDTPVKRYSSGMFLRLGFAVAAHLEPEIMIVDEVLAVGDAKFQKKCLGKMGDVAKEGRTVLFVSHLDRLKRLCKNIWQPPREQSEPHILPLPNSVADQGVAKSGRLASRPKLTAVIISHPKLATRSSFW
jgi:lipopolysaccharide transport system ATP-binding protein